MDANGARRYQDNPTSCLQASDVYSHKLRVVLTFILLCTGAFLTNNSGAKPAHAADYKTSIVNRPLSVSAYEFTGQGELTGITGTIWTIGNLPVTVIDQTALSGDPQVGDFVSVSGVVLSGNLWLAYEISVSPPGASSFRFTAPVESMASNFWYIGAVPVAVNSRTELIGDLQPGTLAQVTFSVLTDGTLVAQTIQAIGETQATATATATLTATPTITPSPTATLTPVPPLILNCYQITFLGVIYNSDNTSTWSYHIAELPCAQDLSNWMVALPSCAWPIDATPTPWEFVDPDPVYRLTGIKWEVGAGFEQGVFTLTVEGHWESGTTQVGVKGPDVAIGISAGPSCQSVSPTFTPTPTSAGSVTPTPSVTPSVTATITLTPSPTTPPPPTLTPVPPPPTQPPPSGGGSPIVVSDNDQTRTFTCNGNPVTINGNNNTITLLGSCGAVTVRGNNNWVSIQAAASVTNTGNNNTIVGP